MQRTHSQRSKWRKYFFVSHKTVQEGLLKAGFGTVDEHKRRIQEIVEQDDLDG